MTKAYANPKRKYALLCHVCGLLSLVGPVLFASGALWVQIDTHLLGRHGPTWLASLAMAGLLGGYATIFVTPVLVLATIVLARVGHGAGKERHIRAGCTAAAAAVILPVTLIIIWAFAQMRWGR